MDPLETLLGPLGVPDVQFGHQSWTPWESSRGHLGSPNLSLGTSHGPTGNPRTIGWEPVMDLMETLEGPLEGPPAAVWEPVMDPMKTL